MRIKFSIFFATMALFATACSVSFSTAKIESFNFGKNDKATPSTTTFNVGEQVFAVANIAGATGKNKVKWKITPTGGKPFETEGVIDGNRPSIYSFTPTTPADFSFEVALFDEDGKELDKKSGAIKVTGTAAAPKADDKADDKAADDDEATEKK
jgi:hypothetical protein